LAASAHPGGIPCPALDEQLMQLTFCLIGDKTTAERE
jgi:hypothetical protein